MNKVIKRILIIVLAVFHLATDDGCKVFTFQLCRVRDFRNNHAKSFSSAAQIFLRGYLCLKQSTTH